MASTADRDHDRSHTRSVTAGVMVSRELRTIARGEHMSDCLAHANDRPAIGRTWTKSDRPPVDEAGARSPHDPPCTKPQTTPTTRYTVHHASTTNDRPSTRGRDHTEHRAPSTCLHTTERSITDRTGATATDGGSRHTANEQAYRQRTIAVRAHEPNGQSELARAYRRASRTPGPRRRPSDRGVHGGRAIGRRTGRTATRATG